jgi:hypothetical protein
LTPLQEALVELDIALDGVVGFCVKRVTGERWSRQEEDVADQVSLGRAVIILYPEEHFGTFGKSKGRFCEHAAHIGIIANDLETVHIDMKGTTVRGYENDFGIAGHRTGDVAIAVQLAGKTEVEELR